MTTVTESDIRELKELIKEVRNELKQDIRKLQNELKQDIQAVRVKVKVNCTRI